MILSLFWLLLYICAELIVIYVRISAGLLVHAGLILILLAISFFRPQMRSRPALLVISLCSLLRILSFTLPSNRIPESLWLGIVGLPMLIAVYFARLAIPSPWRPIQWNRMWWLKQVAVGSVGILLGIVGFALFHTKPIVKLDYPLQWLLNGISLVLFSALLEEMLFRRLMQQAVRPFMGKFNIVFASILFAATYLGGMSPLLVFFMFLIGLMFGIMAELTQSIWGVVIAHSFMALGMFLILPTLFK